MTYAPVDLEAILAGIPDSRSPGALDRWLDEDAKRAADFWWVIENGRARGKSFEKLLGGWNAAQEVPANRCPVKQNQLRVAFTSRESARAQKRG